MLHVKLITGCDLGDLERHINEFINNDIIVEPKQEFFNRGN